MSQPILKVSELKVSFPGAGVAAVRNLSFEIAQSETLAIVGESGSGKSVTALSVMRLLRRADAWTSGSILLDGVDLLKLGERRMRDIRGNVMGMIFQEPMTCLNPVLPVGQQIAEVLAKHRRMSFSAALQEAERLLVKVRVPDPALRLKDYPHRFSGGMRQRIMIAMAIACKPKLLIADEPTTALDVTIQAQILNLIKELQQEYGMAVLFITHDMGVVAQISDRVVVMQDGRAIESKPTRTLFDAPEQSYTKALLAAVPRLGSMADSRRPTRFPVVDPGTGDIRVEAGAASPALPDDTLLKVRNLITRFDIGKNFLGRVSGRVHAVENVSFDLHAGETLAIVGESGCGKSTLARSIMRLVDIQSGSIELEGGELSHLSGEAMRRRRRAMQMVFQDPFASLNPRLRVGDMIAEPMLAHGLATHADVKDRVASLLREVGLIPDHGMRYPYAFSGGQRQRLCIARALAMQPRIIVADEAVSALDASIKAQIVNLMLDLQERFGLSYLFISHDMAVVERISHRVAVMYLGEIVEMGPRQAVFGNPQHPYTKRLLAAVPTIHERNRKPAPVPEIEVPSAIRSLDYVPPTRTYLKPGPDHIVQDWR